MIGTQAVKRAVVAAMLCAGLAAVLPAGALRAAEPSAEDLKLFEEKCSFCHKGHRIYRLTPEEVRPVVERMAKLNPDWITEVDSQHIIRVVSDLLGDPSALAKRTAWVEAVDRGERLFRDTGLGTSGKSCSSCHAPVSLRNVQDAYPKFNPELKRFVGLDEAINLMIRDKLKGEPLPPNDQRYFDLLAYLKSIK